MTPSVKASVYTALIVISSVLLLCYGSIHIFLLAVALSMVLFLLLLIAAVVWKALYCHFSEYAKGVR